MRSEPPPASVRLSEAPVTGVRFSGPPRSARFQEVCILPFAGPRESIAPATAFRTTWLVTSLQTLRERGHFEAYKSKLAAYREDILTVVAGTWVPMTVARAHYDACAALNLSVPEQLAMGRSVGDRAQGTLLATAAKAARGAGATPLIILPQIHRLWVRGANGGAAAIYQVGPKEARAEFVGCELFDVDYFRNAFRGVLLGIGQLFTRTPYVHDVPRRGRGEAVFQLQWT